MRTDKYAIPVTAKISPQEVEDEGTAESGYVTLGPDYQGVVAVINVGDLGTGEVDATWTQAKKDRSTATVTLTNAVATKKVTINGVDFTATNGAENLATGAFDQRGDDTADAASLAACINASTNAGVKDIFRATSALGVVTITVIVPGTYTLVSNDGSMVCSTFTDGFISDKALEDVDVGDTMDTDNTSMSLNVPLQALDRDNGFDSLNLVLTVSGGTGAIVSAVVLGVDQSYLP